MADELRYYADIAEKTAVKNTGSLSDWTAFLSAVGRLYKWPYEDQLLIFAQRPDASACADLAVWNRMGRYIRRNSKAIVLLDTSGAAPVPRYVFDFSDTRSGANARVPWIWKYDDHAHRQVVTAAMDQAYGRSKETDTAARLDEISERLAKEYWKYHREEILEAVPGSFLEEYDEWNVEAAFCHAASVSIAYTLMSRCNLDPDSYFVRRDFESVFEFNTPAVAAALGCAVSQSSEDVLRLIETAVKHYERQKQEERGTLYGTGLHAGGRLPDSGRGSGRTAGPSFGQIRPDAQRLPAGTQAHPMGAALYQRGTVSALPGNRGRGQQPYGADPPRTGAVGGSNGGTESPRPHGMGGADERLQSPGGRVRSAGTGVLLKQFGGVQGQFSLFPTEQEQIQTIKEADRVPPPPPAATPGSAEIDNALLRWNGREESRRAVAEYMAAHGRERETAAWLAREYGVEDAGEPLRLDIPGVEDAALLTWPQVQRRIARLIRAGRFYHSEEPGSLFEDLPQTEAPKPPRKGAAAVSEEAVTPPTAIHPESTERGTETEDTAVFVESERERQIQPDRASVSAGNFRVTDDHLGEGRPKAKFRANMDAVRTLKQIESEGRPATREEQEVLSRYVGWGGLSDAFDPEKTAWKKEYKELQAALTPEEYAAARASTLNAYYTSPTVIRAVYDALEQMGFRSGSILEPACGVGNFFGLLPESMSGSKLYGVELDSVSGRIAKQLYPDASITVAGFETTDRRDFYDIAIGNVPFGQYQVNDPAYNRLGFSIHNYFLAKSLDQIRPGGVMAFVTSRYTMDAQSPEVRKYLAQRADLLGAVRLPNNAFKANAGTDVVSDILFFQKRERRTDTEPDWVHLDRSANGFPINSYFAEHPEMILGRQSSESTRYGEQEFTVKPIRGVELADQLREAVRHIYGVWRNAELPDLGEDVQNGDVLPADPEVRNYSFAIVDGEPYYRRDSVMVRAGLSAAAKERVRGMVELRDCVRRLIDLQMDGNTPDSAIHAEQETLNRLYDAYTARYGLINDRANRLAFSDDSAYYLLCSLEVLDEDGKLERKADFFTKRTIKQRRSVSHVDTASEALAVSIGERACVDLEFMASLMRDGGENNHAELIPRIVESLRGVIYKDPLTGPFDYAAGGVHWARGWQTADEYLSGNVRRKLRQARAAAVQHPEFQINVEALERVQPKDLDASEIEVRLGTTWIDKSVFQRFMYETFHTPVYLRHDTIVIEYSPRTAEWHIRNKGGVGAYDVAAYSTYGTKRANAYRLLEDALNLRDTRVYDVVEDADGKTKRVLNAKETTLAGQKQAMIREAFKDWIWRDPERREKLVRQYNEEMNSTRPREYDGSHLVFSGMNPEITLREHQKNAVAHILYGGNTLLAHEVGAGKTFEMIAAAMESKRLGLCSKSIFVVPNHLIDQWASEFLRLYPAANLLVATKKDFEKRNRKKFCARISVGDYDAVIIGQSQFERIPVSRERLERTLQREIEEVEDGIQELKRNFGAHFSIKQMEKTRKSLEARLKKLEAEEKKDDVVCFEELGVDRMFVDESDYYKNGFVYTKMRNVAGISVNEVQKAADMFAKCRYMDELTGNRGVIFASATAVSNSVTELFILQRYLQYDRLQEMGMGHFDCWASRFGETVTALELAPEGTGYRARTRFAKFFNLEELMALFREAADIKTADQLNLPVPKVEYHTCAARPTEIQRELMQALSERASRVHAGIVSPKEDNMLRITADGRKLGLDQRIIDPAYPDEAGTKVNLCVQNVLRYWREGEAEKLTQLVFCDISTPRGRKSGGRVESGFTIYDDIRRKLIAGGMPPEQIAFIHDADTEAKKRELFSKMRSGQVRVLIGSTVKCGQGMNIQDRLLALHDLDCPWRPADLTQRKGRIERQGNRNETVHVFRYVTESSFDSYLWQTVENKQKFISQILTSKSPVRSCEDIDETALSFAEIKALCAGDPRIKERMDLDVEVSRLKIMKADHMSRQFQMEDNLLKYFPEHIAESRTAIQGLEADTAVLAAHPLPSGGFAGMEIRGTVYRDRERAGEALLHALANAAEGDPVRIGQYRGFEVSVYLDAFLRRPVLTLEGEMRYSVEPGADAKGNIARMDNELDRIAPRLTAVRNRLDNLLQQQKAAQAEVGKPFPFEKELGEKTARLALLDMQLSLDRPVAEPEQAMERSVPHPAVRRFPEAGRKRGRER